jgi:kynurenine formamidase
MNLDKKLFVMLGVGLFATVTHAFEPGDYRLIDLSYSYNEDTIYWPTSPSTFQLQQLNYGQTEAGFFYSANTFSTPEHGGTHIDAPIHFHEHGKTVDQIPIDQLVLPGVVIDIADKAGADRNYRLQKEDVLAFETAHGQIPAGTAVLIRTGWGKYWPDIKQYLGDDTPGDASRLEFPGFGEAAVRLLIEQRHIAMIGIDTASIDYGRSRDFIVHQVASSHNVPGLENLAQLDKLPAKGFILIALPLKIEGGSGGPTRVIALVPDHP